MSDCPWDKTRVRSKLKIRRLGEAEMTAEAEKLSVDVKIGGARQPSWARWMEGRVVWRTTVIRRIIGLKGVWQCASFITWHVLANQTFTLLSSSARAAAIAFSSTEHSSCTLHSSHIECIMYSTLYSFNEQCISSWCRPKCCTDLVNLNCSYTTFKYIYSTRNPPVYFINVIVFQHVTRVL